MVFQHHLDDDDVPERTKTDRIIKTCRLAMFAAIVVVVVVFPARVGGVFSKEASGKVVKEICGVLKMHPVQSLH